jgi:hypothetical protein
MRHPLKPGDRVYLEGEVVDDSNHAGVPTVRFPSPIIRAASNHRPHVDGGPELYLVKAESLKAVKPEHER